MENNAPDINKGVYKMIFAGENNYVIPQPVEVSGKPWIYFGKDNLYPDYLIDLFNRSAKHNAIVTGKKEYICGKGFGDNIKAQPNPDETYNDLLEKIALDLEIFGGFYLECIWNNAKTKIVEIYHIDFTKIRAGNLDPNFLYKGARFDYYFSNDWTKWTQSAAKTDFRGFNKYNASEPGGAQLFSFKEYRPKMLSYAIPDYVGAIPYIEVDVRIANFHLNNIKNGFASNLMINFNNGIPTLEEQTVIERKIRNKFTGDNSAGTFVLNFSDSRDTSPEILPINIPDLDKQFIAMDENVMKNIFIGHKIAPLVLGIETPGSLGSTGGKDKTEAVKDFQKKYISHKQQLIERSLKNLTGLDLKIIPADIPFALPENLLATAMTKDEVRDIIGLKPMNVKGVSDVLPAPVPVTEPPIKLHKIQFSKERDYELLSKFEKIGRSKKDFTILKTKRKLKFGDVALAEIENLENNFFEFKGGISALAAGIIAFLIRKPKAKPEEIAKYLDKPLDDVKGEIADLVVKGLIGDGGVTPAGRDGINKKIVIQNVFSYEKRPEADGDTLLPTSRPFCRGLIEFDKMYTPRELRALSDQEGYDVVEYGGGYWHDPQTDTTYEHCRHEFVQHTVTTIQ